MTPSETRPMPPDPDATAPPPGDATPPRPAVRFAAGPSPSDPESDEFRTFLRRRLLVLVTISFGFILLFEGVLTPFQVQGEVWKYLVYGWAIVAGAGALSAILWRWRSASLRALRWLELAGLVGLAAYLTLDLCERLFEWYDLRVFTFAGYTGVAVEVPNPDGPRKYTLHRSGPWMVWAVTHWLTLKWVLLST